MPATGPTTPGAARIPVVRVPVPPRPRPPTRPLAARLLPVGLALLSLVLMAGAAVGSWASNRNAAVECVLLGAVQEGDSFNTGVTSCTVTDRSGQPPHERTVHLPQTAAGHRTAAAAAALSAGSGTAAGAVVVRRWRRRAEQHPRRGVRGAQSSRSSEDHAGMTSG